MCGVLAGVVVRGVVVAVAAVFVRAGVVVGVLGVGVPKMSAMAEFVGVLDREFVVRPVVAATGGVAVFDPCELVAEFLGTTGGLLRAFTVGAVLLVRVVCCVDGCAAGGLDGGLFGCEGGATFGAAPLCTTTIAPGLLLGALFCVPAAVPAFPFSTTGVLPCCPGGFCGVPAATFDGFCTA